jgi:hypothetical protein
MAVDYLSTRKVDQASGSGTFPKASAQKERSPFPRRTHRTLSGQRAATSSAKDELPFDTVTYGIGNWYLYNGDTAKAQEYFRRVLRGHVWITWGFVGSETELLRKSLLGGFGK